MDSISNLIINIKNANKARKEAVLYPYSAMALAVAEALEKKGYVKSVAKKGKKVSKLEIRLAYNGDEPAVSGAERISGLSRRAYVKAKDIRSDRSSFGTVVLSTTKGILTDTEARKEKVGGEPLFRIW